ncbi:MAG: ROK family protein [Acidobacteria bacterium]|nr:ROK family protein [Acidobacteriota bacterium]
MKRAPIYGGIDLGGTSITVGLVDSQGELLAQDNFPTDVARGATAIIDKMADRLQLLCGPGGERFSDIASIGVGSPGPLDLKTGTVVFTPNLRWTNVPLKALLEERLRKPVIVDNDAVAATFGEWWVGAGRPYEDIVGLTLGTGVGGGIILGGRIHHGFQGVAGHIGHMVIVANGRPCHCGNQGCLEAYVSATAISARGEEALKAGAASVLHHVEKPLTSKKIFQSALQGDAFARRLFDETAWFLAIGINNVLNILNPQAVVIAGAVANAGELLFRPLREHLAKIAFPQVGAETRVLPGKMGEFSGVVGAAGMARFSTQ